MIPNLVVDYVHIIVTFVLFSIYYREKILEIYLDDQQ